jgi:hypothetical protein
MARLAKLERDLRFWTMPHVLKDMYDSVPRESTLSGIYFKRYLELVAPEALERARSCASYEEIQLLIDSVHPESLEAETYCFVQQYEMVAQTAVANAKKCSSVKELQILMANTDYDSIAHVIYDLRLLELSGVSVVSPFTSKE